ncbi:hypothetical protein [Yimella sp. cx-51]|uniref:hypothetical protein n=1 Tax=Yimella sp. cx-51 TaxID=2770551 RepID=UPI00165D9DD5|nr:hypothetical protein [Yimella sp. cx-51]MBC9956964.1 hypothetical protein [Yimella sp. cx-51]MBD2760037.1 hypothetical protein [Yimella sp. cx-573]QTH39180.1 hypothetical protein J5M86_06105 [Yimella sp. cx-51]
MPQVTAKKKCCKKATRCKKCPVVLSRLSKRGHAERHSRRKYTLHGKVPKKVWKVARVR